MGIIRVVVPLPSWYSEKRWSYNAVSVGLEKCSFAMNSNLFRLFFPFFPNAIKIEKGTSSWRTPKICRFGNIRTCEFAFSE